MRATYPGNKLKPAPEENLEEESGPTPGPSERAEFSGNLPDGRTTADPLTIQEQTRHLCLAIEIVARKWHINVLHHLADGPLRASQLQKALEEVAPKVLTQTLRGLERNGLVQRRTYAFIPPRVEYELTDAAVNLLAALEELCRWSEKYGRQTILARNMYDAEKNHAGSNRPAANLSQVLNANLKKQSRRRSAL